MRGWWCVVRVFSFCIHCRCVCYSVGFVNAVIGFCVVKCYWFGGVCVFSFRVVCLSGLAIVLRICICMYIHTYICVCVKNGCNHTQVNVCMYRALYVCGVYIIVSSTLLCVYV